MYFCSQIIKYHYAMIQIPIESMNLMMLNVGYATHHADWNWQKVSSPLYNGGGGHTSSFNAFYRNLPQTIN